MEAEPCLHVRDSGFRPQHHTQQSSRSEGLGVPRLRGVEATPGKVNSESSASPTKALGGRRREEEEEEEEETAVGSGSGSVQVLHGVTRL